MFNIKNLTKVMCIALACASINSHAFGMGRSEDVANLAANAFINTGKAINYLKLRGKTAWSFIKLGFCGCFVKCRYRNNPELQKTLMLGYGMQAFGAYAKQLRASISKHDRDMIDNILNDIRFDDASDEKQVETPNTSTSMPELLAGSGPGTDYYQLKKRYGIDPATLH